MASKKQLSVEERSQIAILRTIGKSLWEISKFMHSHFYMQALSIHRIELDRKCFEKLRKASKVTNDRIKILSK